MEKLLVKLMFIAAIAQLGLTLHDFQDCRKKECLVRIERASRNILDVDWRPITILSEEAARFK